jgi:mRNA interferase RelE/StbE
MNYDLLYTQRAIRDIEKLDLKIKKRLGKALLRYKEELLRYAKKIS